MQYTDAYRDVSVIVINDKLTIYHSDRVIFYDTPQQANDMEHMANTEHIIIAILSHLGHPTKRSTMDLVIKCNNDPISFISFWEASQIMLFEPYSLPHNLNVCVSSASDVGRVIPKVDNKSKITAVSKKTTIYIHFRHWSSDNVRYSRLQLPQQNEESYMTSHSKLTSYSHATALLDSDILVTPALLQQYPHIRSDFDPP